MDSNPKLRIHVEEDLAREERLKQRLHTCMPEAKALAEQFETTTGWLLNYNAATPPGDLMADQAPTPVFGRFEISDMSAKWPVGKPTVSRAESERLLANINRLVARIERLELTQHQPLGTLIEVNEDSPVIPTNLSDKVANLLRFAKQEFSALGAAVYLLDEATTHLRLRSMIAPVPFAHEVESVRSLEHSLADLESLIGNKVNIHSREMGETWKIPKPFQFGWCVVLGTKNLPLGTLWIFFSDARNPSSKELDFLESLNHQLHSEISSREKSPSDPASELLQQELILASRSNDARLPSFAPEIDGWKIAGWTYRHGYLASTFHDWAVTPSGNLSVAVGQVSGPMLTSAMSLNNLRSLVSAHREYRHTSQSMAAKLNEQIWCHSPGDETAALIYVLIEPETNLAHLVNAGDGGVVFSGPRGIQSIDQFQSPLGMDLDTSYEQWEQVLKESDTFVMFSQGLRHAISESMPSANDADLLRTILLAHPGHPHAILSAIEERFFNSDFQHVAGDLSVVVLARNSQAAGVHEVAAEVSKSILAELRAEEGDLLESLVKRIEQPDDWDEDYYTGGDAGIDAEAFDEHWSHDESTFGVIDDDDQIPEIATEIATEAASQSSDPIIGETASGRSNQTTNQKEKPKAKRAPAARVAKSKSSAKKPTLSKAKAKTQAKLKAKSRAKATTRPKPKAVAKPKVKATAAPKVKAVPTPKPKAKAALKAKESTKLRTNANGKTDAANSKAKLTTVPAKVGSHPKPAPVAPAKIKPSRAAAAITPSAPVGKPQANQAKVTTPKSDAANVTPKPRSPRQTKKS
jgi:serine phosphatase RsbU (regulator of sigma subunit)